jgi:RNA polymerase sigma factor (sigma-70 family)
VSVTRNHLPPFEAVIELHGPAVLRFCVAQTGSERGEDVFQETMLAALRAYDEVRDPGAIGSWLFSIAARKAVDSHRGRARAPEPVADPEPPPLDDDGPVLSNDGIWQLVRSLPGKQRTAVTLRYLADLSHREIAEVMQTSEDAARRNVFEGLRRLREHVTETLLERSNPRDGG